MIERARGLVVEKPWGVTNIMPWGAANVSGGAIGELWYEREGASEPSPGLLLKLLFTSQPLSIQVHPDDAYVRELRDHQHWGFDDRHFQLMHVVQV